MTKTTTTPTRYQRIDYEATMKAAGWTELYHGASFDGCSESYGDNFTKVATGEHSIVSPDDTTYEVQSEIHMHENGDHGYGITGAVISTGASLDGWDNNDPFYTRHDAERLAEREAWQFLYQSLKLDLPPVYKNTLQDSFLDEANAVLCNLAKAGSGVRPFTSHATYKEFLNVDEAKVAKKAEKLISNAYEAVNHLIQSASRKEV